MGFSRENISRIRADFANRRQEAAAESDRRRALLAREIPGVAELDAQLSAIGPRVMQTALAGGDVEGAVAQMQKEHEALRRRRGDLLAAHGYAPDYSDIKYRCEECLDTGFIGTKMCGCMRRALIEAGYESSGIGRLMETQSFSTFSLDYYSGEARAMMEANKRNLDEFAQHFGEHTGENWLLIGATGLGKTHLSTAVARAVIDAGFDVVYDTAQGMFSAFETSRFGHGDGGEERYFDAELLIIDDLGTEVTNSFTVSCLYEIINTRLNARRATILNTNLNRAELRERYADRITSRLFGEFRPLVFSGVDIRAQKLKNGAR